MAKKADKKPKVKKVRKAEKEINKHTRKPVCFESHPDK